MISIKLRYDPFRPEYRWTAWVQDDSDGSGYRRRAADTRTPIAALSAGYDVACGLLLRYPQTFALLARFSSEG